MVTLLITTMDVMSLLESVSTLLPYYYDDVRDLALNQSRCDVSDGGTRGFGQTKHQKKLTMTSVAAANSSVPRIVRNVFSHQAALLSPLSSPLPSPCTAKKNVDIDNDHFNYNYSPHDLLSQFHRSLKLTVKRSLKNQHRFFMYEEQSHYGDVSSVPCTVTVSPNELATLLQSNRSTSDYHYYWTSPIADVAPQSMMSKEFHWYNRLQSYLPLEALDPRGPSLWMGTSGSGTQCHYDVADNIIVQLYGTKRIRIYPPSVGVYNLHVYPDAHPKARKSQVDFDFADNLSNSSGSVRSTNIDDALGVSDDNFSRSDENGGKIFQRFPHYFSAIPNPAMDVILQPGDALRIPAFWFHHVENGYVLTNCNRDHATTSHDDVRESICGYNGFDNHQPSISFNSFALSESIMIARRIFQSASRPLGGVSVENSSSILRALGIALIRGLNVVNYGEEKEFIRTYLLEARYSPLLHLGNNSTNNHLSLVKERNDMKSPPPPLAIEQQRMISLCVEKILPGFHQLESGGGEEEDAVNENRVNDGGAKDKNGIKLLVALHLLELWAVELVGPKLVSDAWERALS